MDIEKAGDKVDQASGFFDKLNKFIKKHPIWFIVILIIALFYWASTLPEVEEESDSYYNDEYYDEGYYEEEGDTNYYYE
jgi:hypothetical protein